MDNERAPRNYVENKWRLSNKFVLFVIEITKPCDFRKWRCSRISQADQNPGDTVALIYPLLELKL